MKYLLDILPEYHKEIKMEGLKIGMTIKGFILWKCLGIKPKGWKESEATPEKREDTLDENKDDLRSLAIQKVRDSLGDSLKKF